MCFVKAVKQLLSSEARGTCEFVQSVRKGLVQKRPVLEKCYREWKAGKAKAIGAIVISQARRGRKKGEATPFLDNGPKINRKTNCGQPHGCGQVLISPEEEMALSCWARGD